jgi:hypothetical protein
LRTAASRVANSAPASRNEARAADSSALVTRRYNNNNITHILSNQTLNTSANHRRAPQHAIGRVGVVVAGIADQRKRQQTAQSTCW